MIVFSPRGDTTGGPTLCDCATSLKAVLVDTTGVEVGGGTTGVMGMYDCNKWERICWIRRSQISPSSGLRVVFSRGETTGGQRL